MTQIVPHTTRHHLTKMLAHRVATRQVCGAGTALCTGAGVGAMQVRGKVTKAAEQKDVTDLILMRRLSAVMVKLSIMAKRAAKEVAKAELAALRLRRQEDKAARKAAKVAHKRMKDEKAVCFMCFLFRRPLLLFCASPLLLPHTRWVGVAVS
eukprot:TRINITY_DN1553_c0_g1_i1.p1 TRINITY_DN1553_c0_g1~~TRINITY_DN1553_c0_g1_i1.p1  ORF type:complete len:152 (+),score=27.89 TRINITY_DN1553_c0_g1_i1:193-648(+)